MSWDMSKIMPTLACTINGTRYGLIVWLSFIDDMLIVRKEDAMECIKKMFTETVDCNDIGEMQEYISTKISINQRNKTLKITQPVLVQSLNDEFNFSEPNAKPEMLQQPEHI